MTILTQQEFDQDPERVLKATADGPVFITDHGEPKHVMLSIDEYQRIKSGRISLAEALSMPGLSDIELDWSLPAEHSKPVEFP